MTDPRSWSDADVEFVVQNVTMSPAERPSAEIICEITRRLGPVPPGAFMHTLWHRLNDLGVTAADVANRVSDD